jgi:hypothetical protein
MNRADRLRKVVPGAADDLIAGLAARPVAEVDLVVALARQARRDAIEHAKQARRSASGTTGSTATMTRPS